MDYFTFNTPVAQRAKPAREPRNGRDAFTRNQPHSVLTHSEAARYIRAAIEQNKRGAL